MNPQAIASKLNDMAGFKPLFKGLFGGGKVKKSFAIYSSAINKGVYNLHKVRSATHDDSQYAVYAFSPNGDVTPDALKLITERLANMSLGTIRYECMSYTCLQAWRGEEGSLANENTEITSIAPEHPEVLVFPVADDVSCEYVIYAQKDGEHYVYPITKEQAETVLG